MTGRNSEGYKDPTASDAVGHLTAEERKTRKTLQFIRTAAQLMAKGAGYELTGRLGFRDPHTGREYR